MFPSGSSVSHQPWKFCSWHRGGWDSTASPTSILLLSLSLRTLRAGDPTAVFLQPYGTCWSHAPRPSQSTRPRAARPPWVSLEVGTGVTTTPPRFLAPGLCPRLFRGFPPCRQMPEIVLWGYSFASRWPYNAGWGEKQLPGAFL